MRRFFKGSNEILLGFFKTHPSINFISGHGSDRGSKGKIHGLAERQQYVVVQRGFDHGQLPILGDSRSRENQYGGLKIIAGWC